VLDEAIDAIIAQELVVAQSLIQPKRGRLDFEEKYARWLPAVAPKIFSGGLAWFHHGYWSWLWPLMLGRAAGEPLDDAVLSALMIWGRGLGKSTSLEFTAVAEGALIEQAFGVYISSTQDKTNEHVASIRGAIEASQVAQYYPGLSNPRVGRFGNQRGWRQDAVYTDNGFAIVGAGLDKGIRGLKDISQRPTIFFIDDIDERQDTPLIVEKKWKTLVYDVLPMAELSNPKPIVIFAQNLIHRASVMAKTLRREIPMLGRREEFGPVNTFADDLQIEKVDGRKKIVAGTPNWSRISVAEAQVLLDNIGEDVFRSECQNQMIVSAEERVLSQYDETIHVITWSMFAAKFGSSKIPAHWRIYLGHDWGTTGPTAHPAVLSAVAVAAEDSPLPGDAFLFWARTAEAAETEHQIARRLIEELPRYVWHPGAKQAAALLAESDDDKVTKTEERMWKLRAMAGRALPITVARISHEENKGAAETYRQKWGIPFVICDPAKSAGQSQIQHYLEPEVSQAHPFKPGVMGRPNYYFVVADDQLLECIDDRGLKRHREEALTLRWDPNVAGRDVPVKRGDDAYDSQRMIFQGFPLRAQKRAFDEQVQEQLPEAWRDSNLQKLPPEQAQRLYDAREADLQEIKRSLITRRRPDYYGLGDDDGGSSDDI
jgi:hypothetical protein